MNRVVHKQLEAWLVQVRLMKINEHARAKYLSSFDIQAEPESVKAWLESVVCTLIYIN